MNGKGMREENSQHFRVAQERAGNSDALALAT
jgi:hypothetical protein